MHPRLFNRTRDGPSISFFVFRPSPPLPRWNSLSSCAVFVFVFPLSLSLSFFLSFLPRLLRFTFLLTPAERIPFSFIPHYQTEGIRSPKIIRNRFATRPFESRRRWRRPSEQIKISFSFRSKVFFLFPPSPWACSLFFLSFFLSSLITPFWLCSIVL